jgi:hypothetical protein
MSKVIDAITVDEIDKFFSICSTIGAFIVFPSNKIGKSPTINGARGLHSKVRDRFDLTLECIRRYYHGQDSPLRATLSSYDDFFMLFNDFNGYVNFFFLQDLLSSDCGIVRFFLPFFGFEQAPLPRDVDEYRRYKDALTAFIVQRNRRITHHAAKTRGPVGEP